MQTHSARNAVTRKHDELQQFGIHITYTGTERQHLPNNVKTSSHDKLLHTCSTVSLVGDVTGDVGGHVRNAYAKACPSLLPVNVLVCVYVK